MCFSFWRTSSPRPPTGAPPLDPAGGLPSPRPPHLCSSKISFKKALLLFRFSICGSVPEIFAVKVESCQKSFKMSDDWPS